METMNKTVRVYPLDAHNDPRAARGIFVVGHARSGTTVLTDALNTCPDIHCLMEPYFYRSYDYPSFGNWFNRMHEAFGNPRSKGYWLPDCGEATGKEIVEKLRGSHRYVGEKLAFRQRARNYLTDKFFDFAVANFVLSPFICIVRNPLKVTSSAIDMFENSTFEREIIRSVVQSQLETYLLILRLVQTVPHCYLLAHESIDNNTFVNLGQQLDVKLDRAFRLYSPEIRKTRHLKENERMLLENSRVQLLTELYTKITTLAGNQGAKITVDDLQSYNALASSGAELVSKFKNIS